MSDTPQPPTTPPDPPRGFPVGPPVGDRPGAGSPPPETWPSGPVGPPVGAPLPWAPPGAPGAPSSAPPPGLPGFTPPPGDGGRRSRAAVVVAIFAVVAVLSSLIAFVVVRDDSDDPEATETTTTTTETSITTTTEATTTTTSEPDAPAVDEAELEAVVRELQDYVEGARGLEFSRDVVVELVADDEFERRLLEDFEDGADDLAKAEIYYRALALLDSSDPLIDQLRELYAAGVLGFYDTETDELVVRGTALTPYVRRTIVHELVHALDDQHFELFRPEYDERDDEVPVAFSAVVEGNARRVERAWLAEQPQEVQDQVAAEEAAVNENFDADGFPYALLWELGAPYEFGQVFVSAILSGQGERAVDQALTTPPTTSEQILYPEVYLAGEPAVAVPIPPADGEVVDQGALGVLMLLGFLSDPEEGVDAAMFRQAAEGWGGDAYVTWTDGDANCVRLDVVGDTTADTDELRAALSEWSETRNVGTVSNVDGRVRLESCMIPASGPESNV